MSADERVEPETLTGEPVANGDGRGAEREREDGGPDAPGHVPSTPDSRSDPRLRPPDPAGTQPKHDPESLLPARRTPAEPERGLGFASTLGYASSAPPPPSNSLAPAAAADAGGLDRPQEQSRHAPRFQFLLGALGAVAVAAVAIAVAIASQPRPGPGPAWSAWHPVSGDVDPAQQIAEHVGPEYRLDNGHQIVTVQGGPLSFGGQQAAVALRLSGSQPAELPGNGVIYQLCGSGTNCSIGEGKPSAQRLLLLRREALELALYTFRYVSGADEVVVVVPPSPSAAAGSPTSATGSASGSAASSSSSAASALLAAAAGSDLPHALFFRPQDVAGQLDRPLGMSLSTRTPTVSTIQAAPDTNLVAQLTKDRFYDYSIVQDQQQNPVYLLQPQSLGP